MKYYYIAMLFIMVSYTDSYDDIEIYEKLEIVSDEGVFNITNLSVDINGDIYITERMFYTVNKLSSDGILSYQAGDRGSGPGEFTIGPSYISIFDSILVVVDFQTPIINVFSRTMDYISRIILSEAVNGIYINEDNHLFVSTLNVSKQKEAELISIYDLYGNKISGITMVNLLGELLLDSFKFTVDNNNYLIVAYNSYNRIDIYDNEGDIYSSFTINGLQARSETNIIGNMKAPTGAIFTNIAVDNNTRYVYILGGHYSKNPKKDIYVYDYYGNPITTLNLPHSTNVLYIDENNKLYTTNEDDSAIIVYEIIYK